MLRTARLGQCSANSLTRPARQVRVWYPTTISFLYTLRSHYVFFSHSSLVVLLSLYISFVLLLPTLAAMSSPRILIYLLRRDLRFADNPIFHEVIKSYQQSNHAFTHLLPLYVFPAQQIEVSGFLASESERSPYPEARSPAGGFWRCGKHRAKFLAESVFDLKKTLQGAGCGLEVRVGMIADVVQGILDAYATEKNEGEVVSVWMTSEEGVEEKREERAVRSAVEKQGKEFRLWQDEKYFIDEYECFFSTYNFSSYSCSQ